MIALVFNIVFGGHQLTSSRTDFAISVFVRAKLDMLPTKIAVFLFTSLRWYWSKEFCFRFLRFQKIYGLFWGGEGIAPQAHDVRLFHLCGTFENYTLFLTLVLPWLFPTNNSACELLFDSDLARYSIIKGRYFVSMLGSFSSI